MVFHISDQTCRSRSSTYTANDYYDSSSAITINSIDTTNSTITLASVPAGLSVGDSVERTGVGESTITNINGSTLTVDDVDEFTTGAGTAYIGFDASATYCPVAEAMGVSKLFEEGHIVFDGASIAPGSLTAYNNNSNNKLAKYVTTTFKSDLEDTAGTDTQFADSSDHPFVVRFWPPFNYKRGTLYTLGFAIRVCRNTFRLVGIDVVQDGQSTRTSRRNDG
jgi:hypothetical protein